MLIVVHSLSCLQVVCIGVLSLVDLKTNRTPSQHEAKIAVGSTIAICVYLEISMHI